MFTRAIAVESSKRKQSSDESLDTEDYLNLLFYSVFELITDVRAHETLFVIICLSDYTILAIVYIYLLRM